MEHATADFSKLDADAFVNLLKERVPKMSAATRATLAVTLAVSGLCKRPDLADGQKTDILNAALNFYRLTVLADFLQMVVTSEDGKPGDLLIDRSEASTKTLRYHLSSALLAFVEDQNKAADRFRTLATMLTKGEQ
jgi:hypothetical protein